MIEDKDIRVLALLYWQLKCTIDSGCYVPIGVATREEGIEIGESIRRLSNMELIDGTTPDSEGHYLPVPNGKGIDTLMLYPDISAQEFQEFDQMARAFVAESASVRRQLHNMQFGKSAARPSARPRKKVKRHVS